jgi:tripartite-type tricarboxylate transporter receptor subunit TctC
MMHRRAAMACSMACLWTLAALPAHAQPYPARPIQFFVAFGPGGAGDVVARVVARKMSESMGQPIVVENRPAPTVAVTTVKNARPDGYALVMAGSGTALTNGLFKSLPYDLMGDFIHVSTLASFDLALITGPKSPLQSPTDVIAYARKNPGKLNIATARIGSTQNLAAEMFKSMAGIDVVIVPYRTTADLLTAVRSGDAHIAFEMLPPILGQIRSDTVKAIAVSSAKRHASLPTVPTVAESGVPGYDAGSWNGVSVPAGTPAAVVARLEKEVATAIASPEVRSELERIGMSPMAGTSQEMSARMRADIAKWSAVIEKAGIEKQ